MNDLNDSKEDEMLLMLEKMQGHIESLQANLQAEKDKNSKMQEKTSQLFSENLILKSEVQKNMKNSAMR